MNFRSGISTSKRPAIKSAKAPIMELMTASITRSLVLQRKPSNMSSSLFMEEVLYRSHLNAYGSRCNIIINPVNVLVYSVLGKGNYRVVDFSYKECKDENWLASYHYKRCREREGKRVKLTYFISPEAEEEAKKLFKEIVELLSLEGEGWEKAVLPSFGYSEKKNYRYNIHYPYITLVILLRMLLDIYKSRENLEEVVADISQGWNLYVSGLVDAIRTASVFWNLLNYTDSRDVRFKILFSDPVIGVREREKPFEIHEDEVKVWFDFPLKPDKGTLEKVGLNTEEIRTLKNALRTYRAIKGNAPLVILTFGYDKKEKIDTACENYIQRLWNKYNPERSYMHDGIYDMPDPEEVNLIKSVLLSFALYRSMSSILERFGIPSEGTESAELDRIESSFIGDEDAGGIYDKYGLSANLNFCGT